MNRLTRGYTLIELMIVVSIIGIAVTALGNGLLQQRERGADILSEERALQVLEYEADCLARGQLPDPEIHAGLLSALPTPQLTRESAPGGRVTVNVSWRASNGERPTRSLTIFGKTP